MKFADKYPDVQPFQEPMQGIIVVPDHAPCHVCRGPTRFLDYHLGLGLGSVGGVALCSEECAFELPPATEGRSL